MEQRLQGFESGAKIQGTLVLLDEYPSIRDGHVGFFLTLYHFQMWTKGGLDGENLVILGINQCRSEEEGVSSLFITKMMNIPSFNLQDYKCILKNDCGEDTFEFKLFVTVEGGMDFRAMLLKKKKPAKKVVVLEYEWLETPVDVTVQEGKAEQITFSARLSEKDKKGKWFLRNEETLKSNLALEHGVVPLCAV